jgi:type VI secretion system protein ImpC
MAEEETEKQAAQETAEESASLLDSIMQETKIKPSDESYQIAKTGLEAFLRHVIDRKEATVKQAVVNEMITELDKKMFQKLESAWRGL